MKVAKIGATSNFGSKILAEVLNHRHEVIGIARTPDKLKPYSRLTARCWDMNDEAGLAELLSGHNAVISTVRFQSTDPQRA